MVNILLLHFYDGTTRLWNAYSGQQMSVYETEIYQPPDFARASFSPDGKKVITIAGNRVQAWDSNTGKQLVVLKGHDAQITHAAFSPDGQRGLLLTSFDHTTRLWDVVSGQESTVIEGHSR